MLARVILSAAKDLTANATEPALRGNDARVILSAAKDLTAPGEWHGLREILRCAQDDMPMMLFHGMRFHISIWRYENCTFRQNECQGKNVLACLSLAASVAQPLLKGGCGDVVQEAIEMVVGVVVVVEIEFGDAELQEAPEGLAQVGAEAHQVQVSLISRPHLAEIGAQQLPALLLAERLVDGEVAEIEEDIAHRGIFPVQDADGAPIVDEIAGEQVIMAGSRRECLADGLLDAFHQRKDAGQRVGKSDTGFQRQP